jgi:hypothetical protein
MVRMSLPSAPAPDAGRDVLPVSFVEPDGTIVVNFGILTGREATQAEIDRLAQSLHSDAGAGPDMTIVAQRRQDYGRGIETVSHQVRVSVLGAAGRDTEAVCTTWAVRCADDRRVEPLGG